MNNDEMKSKLTEQLEFWDSYRSRCNGLKMDDMIIQRMEGMIDISFQFGVINEEERAELRYIYKLDGEE